MSAGFPPGFTPQQASSALAAGVPAFPPGLLGAPISVSSAGSILPPPPTAGFYQAAARLPSVAPPGLFFPAGMPAGGLMMNPIFAPGVPMPQVVPVAAPMKPTPVAIIAPAEPSKIEAIETAAVESTAVAKPSVEHESRPTEVPRKKRTKVKSLWTEHTAPDGRKYFYNSETKVSAWQKPDELKTESEKRLDACPWKEFKSDNGKVFYHNTETKESRWAPPPELEEIKAAIKAEEELQAVESESSSDEEKPAETVKQEPSDMKYDTDENSKEAGETATAEKYEAKSIEEAKQIFRDLLKEKNIASSATWEQVVRVICNDPRYLVLKKANERKQVFNTYKQLKINEEKEQERMRHKQNKENLRRMLEEHPRFNSGLRYRVSLKVFDKEEVWNLVPDRERKEIFDEALLFISKREKEDEKQHHISNRNYMTIVYRNMDSIRYCTTWDQAQDLIKCHPQYRCDVKVLDIMDEDKEDALVTYEEHIRHLEKLYDEERLKEKSRQRRQERKNRDAFIGLLEFLHKEGVLNSMSKWVDLYTRISSDPRFIAMIGQTGSNPLDLFKFYIEDLKARYNDEKKIIKEIMKDRNFTVEARTLYEDFLKVVSADSRSAPLDPGNVKMTYLSLLEKAEARDKERQKREERELRRKQDAFLDMLRNASPSLEVSSRWEEVRPRFEKEPAFEALIVEAERISMFKDFMLDLEEEHRARERKRSHKDKKSKKSRRNRSSSSTRSDAEKDSRSRKKRRKSKRSPSRSRSPSADSDSDRESKRKRKKEKKSRKKRTKSNSSVDTDDSMENARSKTSKSVSKSYSNPRHSAEERQSSVKPSSRESVEAGRGSHPTSSKKKKTAWDTSSQSEGEVKGED